MITDLTIIFWTFCLVKALNNSLLHNYKAWKSRLGIPDKWDWWFTSKERDKHGWLIKNIDSFSDAWHTGWTLWMSGVVVYAILRDGIVSGLLITGVSGVFIVFNGVYNFMRRKNFFKEIM